LPIEKQSGSKLHALHMSAQISLSPAKHVRENRRMDVQRPEADLLLWCARTCTDTERADRLRALAAKGIDWDYLFCIAHPHGLMPLLHRRLNAVCPEAIPPNAAKRMNDYFQANTRRNLFLIAQLLDLLNILKANGISAVPYKGPVLAAFIYGDLAFRQFTDLDIFVHRRDVLRAKQLLISLGYQPQYRLSAAQEAAYLASQCELLLSLDDGKVAVELQWQIAPKYFGLSLDVDRLWERLVPVPFAETTVCSFSPEDLLLILCIHGYKHYWDRLDWICDVAGLVRIHREMDWNLVMNQAVMLRAERILFLGLWLAGDLPGAVLPKEILQRMRADAEVKRLAAWVCARLFGESSRPRGAIPLLRFRLKARERLLDKIRYCVGRAMTPTPEDWASLRLPDFLFPLYYPLRPIRLARKYLLACFRAKR
jgi:hypothetical protein